MNFMGNIAIIPARSGSKRIEKKTSKTFSVNLLLLIPLRPLLKVNSLMR